MHNIVINFNKAIVPMLVTFIKFVIERTALFW
jgi:hypothetical protein